MIDGEVFFYGDELLCKQVAFVLGIKCNIISDFASFSSGSKLIVCTLDDKVTSFLKSYRRNRDYYLFNDVLNYIDKNSVKRYVWYDYKKYINLHNLKNLFNIVRPTYRSIEKVNKLSVEFLKPSEMLIKVLNSPQLALNCSNLENTCNVDSDGSLWGCCPGWIGLNFGNILYDDSYDGFIARIIKLSSLNKTYCFCDFNRCKYGIVSKCDVKFKDFDVSCYPKKLTLSIDRACNLKCLSCRKCVNSHTSAKSWKIYEKLKNTKWFDSSYIVLAGQGEVFLSKIYRKILFDDINSKKVHIFSNGTLFNNKNLDKVLSKYDDISVSVSIDAASKDTYKLLRNGNFDILLKNLRNIGTYRSNGKIKRFELNFVVQRDNYKEIVDFIKLAKSISVDRINFTKLTDWGTFSSSEFIAKRMIIDNKYLEKDLYDVLDSVISDSIVNAESFKSYMEESRKIYGKKDL